MKKLLLMVLVFTLLAVAACGSDDDAGGGVVDEVLNVTEVRERADELDGKTVTVRSSYWSNADGQYLSDIMMESYPPQIPFDHAIILTGDIPQEVLDQLDHAEAPYAEITWGLVEVTGELSVDGDEIRLQVSEIAAVLD